MIPAIDIRDGRCVRLEQGDYDRETVFGDDPVKMAVRWAALGAKRIHVVDLDGARDGSQANAEVVRRIVQTVDSAIQYGGGIRDIPTLERTLESGVSRVVIGTAAVKDPQMLRDAVAVAGDHLIVSVDAREGLVSLQGWTESTDISALALIERLQGMGVQRVVYTDIMRDGVKGGPSFTMYDRLTAETSVKVIAAGGVSSIEDLRRLREAGVDGAIIGRALYRGELDLSEAIAAAR
ncbi:MAG: 1-(5-phosphoribosyl)-5-[(5-phosphoribosylamino)methylideneamino]imidazole-4-carboxamide isomerase [Chloroflexi bacterium]|nr:1-(5-phosphoribosyl)-5-[(5-phosphoribosylamino)methylideneamino]imidazole-4-carboxamide isomerase [Chloroflexota bacterium]MDA1147869.1 1-(5-phosphoribosyl)-5-[(5-phosphoribosylamino)methylideneamino]imidazole-4-carboxamide isomerase [Chloroflexota bacterium]